MDYNSEKNTVTLFGKSEKLDTLANRLSSLSGNQVYSLFSTRGITVPRRMNCMALTSVINQKLKKIHASELSKDYFQRLKYYKEFSEVQLYNLFLNICNTKEYFKEYRVNLLKLILMNHVGLNLMDGEIKYLKDLKKLPVETFEDYFQYISSMCQEQEDTFDGQSMKILRDFLVNSASSAEIVNLGKRYGIELSLSLKKTDLIEYMKHYLNHAGELNKNLETEIEASTVAGLNALCKKYRIPMSSNMSKNELVTYLFYILSQCEIVQTSVKRIEKTKEYEPLEFTIDMNVFKGFIPDDTKRILHYAGEENDPFDVVMDTEKMEDAILSLEKEPEEVVDTKVTASVVEEVKKEVEAVQLEDAKEDLIVVESMEQSKTVSTFDAKIEETKTVEIEPVPEQEVESKEAVEEVVEEPTEEPTEEETEAIEEVEVVEDAITEESVDTIEDEALFDAYMSSVQKEEEVTEEEIIPAEETSEQAEEKTKVHGIPMDDVRENKEFGNDKLRHLADGPLRTVLWICLAILLIGLVGVIIWSCL